MGGIDLEGGAEFEEGGVVCWAGRERGVFEGREEVIPDEVEFVLHVFGVGGEDDDGVLFREDDAELAEGTVAAVGVVAAAPELEAVALGPVAVGFIAVRDLSGGGLIDP